MFVAAVSVSVSEWKNDGGVSCAFQMNTLNQLNQVS